MRYFNPVESSAVSSNEVAEEAAYYHLPSNLLSPEITMSTTEFTNSVKRWMQRRQEAQKVADAGTSEMDAKL